MRHQFGHVFNSQRIDEPNGILYGVAVASVGEAKGHKVELDDITLRQVLDCATTYAGGLKVKADHGSGVFSTVGFLTNFQVDGSVLRADFHVFDSCEDRAKLFEMASHIPDTFGLSITFSGPDEVRGKRKFARCTEIYSADLVSEPAANPTGLFSVDNSLATETHQNMDPILTQLAKIATSVEALTLKQAELSTALKQFSMPPPETEEEKAARLAKEAEEKEKEELSTETEEEKAARLAKEKELAASEEGKKGDKELAQVQNELRQLQSKFDALSRKRQLSAPVPVSAASKVSTGPRTFAERVSEVMAAQKLSKTAAIAFCVKNFPDEHRAFTKTGAAHL